MAEAYLLAQVFKMRMSQGVLDLNIRLVDLFGRDISLSRLEFFYIQNYVISSMFLEE